LGFYTIERGKMGEFEQMAERIGYMWRIALMVNIFVIVSVVCIIFIPGVVPLPIKVYLVSVCGLILVGVSVALFLVRGDPMASLFFTCLSLLISGFFGGAAAASVQKILN
jgi:hypothetical protein